MKYVSLGFVYCWPPRDSPRFSRASRPIQHSAHLSGGTAVPGSTNAARYTSSLSRNHVDRKLSSRLRITWFQNQRLQIPTFAAKVDDNSIVLTGTVDTDRQHDLAVQIAQTYAVAAKSWTRSNFVVGMIPDRNLCCSIVAPGWDPTTTPIQKFTTVNPVTC
jgi:hypothetical protein